MWNGSTFIGDFPDEGVECDGVEVNARECEVVEPPRPLDEVEQFFREEEERRRKKEEERRREREEQRKREREERERREKEEQERREKEEERKREREPFRKSSGSWKRHLLSSQQPRSRGGTNKCSRAFKLQCRRPSLEVGQLYNSTTECAGVLYCMESTTA